MIKELHGKAYGSIAHLPQSRLGPADHCLSGGQVKILTEKVRDKYDFVIVQEKVDGSNVCIANIDGILTPLIRSGYLATQSHWRQHHFFAEYVYAALERYSFLEPGERLCGEWLAQAHGTLYDLTGREPFVAFDLMRGYERALYAEFCERVTIQKAPLLHCGGSLSVDAAMELLTPYGHYGAKEPAEGCVWRVEREGKVDFLAKYVRPDKVDGKYLISSDNKQLPPTWNWLPEGVTG